MSFVEGFKPDAISSVDCCDYFGNKTQIDYSQ